MATTNVVTTSFTVSFGSATAGQVLKAEVDDRADGLNKGNTSFLPGDDVGWLLFKSAGVTVDAKVSSLGSLSGAGTGTKEVVDVLQFANEATASLNYPCTAIKSSKWIGSDGGEFVLLNETTVKRSNFKGTPTAPEVFVLQVTYDSPCEMYWLKGTLVENLNDYEILVYISGHSV
jgi:hypothetical protein